MANQMPLDYMVCAISDRIQEDLHVAIEKQLIEAVMPKIRDTTYKIVEEIKKGAQVRVNRDLAGHSLNFTVVFNGSIFKPDAEKE
ncbi:hypothetical protein FP568_13325 [Pandoraea pnomenusa]|uniref:hypothetical protein n=1 Tax=Pandoraea pnomenusa TaxID=93220 RepID=UPI0011982E73|nr:hypothetical protein [Pandoraea pnomenusa]QDX22142.1 hypothetical protein FP568_13325 [Pandoraea pnomenusa]